jgi:transcription elongation factor GreA
MVEVKLTGEGHKRLHTALNKERERLLEVEQFIRQQMLCKCDVDQVSLRDARQKKTRLQQRVEELEEVLSHATVLPKDRSSSSAGLGAFVTLLQKETGEQMVVQLVSAPEAAVAEEAVARISDASPVGRQLVGRRVGDSVEVETGGGRVARYRVMDIWY